MLSPIRFYEIYQSVNLHFKGSYDCFKYNFKTRVSDDKFKTVKGKFFFEKWSRSFRTENDAIAFIFTNVISDNKWIGNYNKDHFLKLEGYKNSLDYRFSEDKKIYMANGYSSLEEYVNRMIYENNFEDITFFIVFNYVFNDFWLNKLKESSDNPLFEEFEKKVLTMTPFIVKFFEIDSVKKKKLFQLF